MDLSHMQICLIIGAQDKPYGTMMTPKKDLSSKPVMILPEEIKFTIHMVKNVIQDFSLITASSINQMTLMRFQLESQ